MRTIMNEFYLQDSSIIEAEKQEWSNHYNNNKQDYVGWRESAINLARRIFVHNYRFDKQQEMTNG